MSPVNRCGKTWSPVTCKRHVYCLMT